MGPVAGLLNVILGLPLAALLVSLYVLNLLFCTIFFRWSQLVTQLFMIPLSLIYTITSAWEEGAKLGILGLILSLPQKMINFFYYFSIIEFERGENLLQRNLILPKTFILNNFMGKIIVKLFILTLPSELQAQYEIPEATDAHNPSLAISSEEALVKLYDAYSKDFFNDPQAAQELREELSAQFSEDPIVMRGIKNVFDTKVQVFIANYGLQSAGNVLTILWAAISDIEDEAIFEAKKQELKEVLSGLQRGYNDELQYQISEDMPSCFRNAVIQFAFVSNGILPGNFAVVPVTPQNIAKMAQTIMNDLCAPLNGLLEREMLIWFLSNSAEARLRHYFGASLAAGEITNEDINAAVQGLEYWQPPQAINKQESLIDSAPILHPALADPEGNIHWDQAIEKRYPRVKKLFYPNRPVFSFFLGLIFLMLAILNWIPMTIGVWLSAMTMVDDVVMYPVLRFFNALTGLYHGHKTSKQIAALFFCTIGYLAGFVLGSLLFVNLPSVISIATIYSESVGGICNIFILSLGGLAMAKLLNQPALLGIGIGGIVLLFVEIPIGLTADIILGSTVLFGFLFSLLAKHSGRLYYYWQYGHTNADGYQFAVDTPKNHENFVKKMERLSLHFNSAPERLSNLVKVLQKIIRTTKQNHNVFADVIGSRQPRTNAYKNLLQQIVNTQSEQDAIQCKQSLQEFLKFFRTPHKNFNEAMVWKIKMDDQSRFFMQRASDIDSANEATEYYGTDLQEQLVSELKHLLNEEGAVDKAPSLSEDEPVSASKHLPVLA